MDTNPNEIEHLQQAAADGNVGSMIELGKRYYYGNGVENNFNKAAELFKKAADGQNAEGEAWFSCCCIIGKGVPQNQSLAVELFERAAAKGNAEADANLFLCYLYGKGTSKDLKRAEKHLQVAADKGNCFALRILAERFRLKKDTKNAISFYERAVANGDELSQMRLGYFYEFGRETPADFTRAISYYEKAALQGNIHGEIGCYRLHGAGVVSSTEQYDVSKLYEATIHHQGVSDRSKHELAFDYDNKHYAVDRNYLSTRNLAELATACDLNKDYLSGLKYINKCVLAHNFDKFPTTMRNAIKASVYFRENGCTDYFNALATNGCLSVLFDRKLKVFIPSTYALPIQEIIRKSIHTWNSAINQYFEVVEVNDKNMANLCFVPINRAVLSKYAIARTCQPDESPPGTTVPRVMATLRNQNPLSAFFISGWDKLLPKCHKRFIQLPNYPCSSKDDFTNMTSLCLHEIGHAFGLGGHSIFGDDVMSYDSNHKASLSPRDINAINNLYQDGAESNILTLLKKGVQENNQYAMRTIAIHLLRNSQHRDGMDLLTKASTLGDPGAQLYLGLCYSTGTGIEKDQKKAIEYFEKAVAQGTPLAHTVLAVCYTNSIGVAFNVAKAATLYEYAAEQGDPLAAQLLGIISTLGIGDGIKRDTKKADRLFQQAMAIGIKGAKFWSKVNTTVQFIEANVLRWTKGLTVMAALVFSYYFYYFLILPGKHSPRHEAFLISSGAMLCIYFAYKVFVLWIGKKEIVITNIIGTVLILLMGPVALILENISPIDMQQYKLIVCGTAGILCLSRLVLTLWRHKSNT